MRYIAIGIVLFALLLGLARAGDLPDLSITPGVVRSGLTKARICSIKWGRDARHVTEAMKREIFAAYGLSGNDDSSCSLDKHGRRYEVDHFLSRELGGADDVRNLWPQCYSGKWNAQLKDKLENRLHKEMCAGNITLKGARDMLVNDWRIAYRRYYGEPPAK